MRRAATTMVFLAGCASAEPRPQGEPAPATIEEPTAAPAKVEEPAEPAEPPLSLALSPVIEGDCRHLDVSLLGGETFVHGQAGWIGRLKPDGTFEDLSLNLEAKYRDDPYYVTVGHVEAIEGAWPDEVFARYLQVDGRMWEGSRYLRRKDGGWHPMASQDEETKAGGGGMERLFQWTGGNWLGRFDCRDYDGCKDQGLWLKVVRGPGKAPKFPELKGKEEGCWASYSMTVLASGEIAAVGRFCHKPREFEEGAWYGVFWSEAGGTKVERLPVREGHGKYLGPIVGVSPTRVVAAVPSTRRDDGSALLFAYDGAGWKAMPPVEGKFAGLDVDAAGTAWVVAGGRLVRGAAGGAWEGVSFPTGPVRQVGGLRESVAYVIQDDGSLWLRPPGQEFQRATVAEPRFASAAKFEVESVRSAGREVWATAKYTETGIGWPKTSSERRRAVLHNGPPREAQRCGDQTFSPKQGLFDWPPAAREDCATPFAILTRAKSWMRKDNKVPELGKLIKGKQELAAAKFAEVEIAGVRIVGAAVPSMAVGRALVELTAAPLKARPELVCATPEVTRALDFDVATGKLIE